MLACVLFLLLLVIYSPSFAQRIIRVEEAEKIFKQLSEANEPKVELIKGEYETKEEFRSRRKEASLKEMIARKKKFLIEDKNEFIVRIKCTHCDYNLETERILFNTKKMGIAGFAILTSLSSRSSPLTIEFYKKKKKNFCGEERLVKPKDFMVMNEKIFLKYPDKIVCGYPKGGPKEGPDSRWYSGYIKVPRNKAKLYDIKKNPGYFLLHLKLMRGFIAQKAAQRIATGLTKAWARQQYAGFNFVNDFVTYAKFESNKDKQRVDLFYLCTGIKYILGGETYFEFGY